ncbi:XrtX-associated membrane protein [Hymenobacter defluvii]|uniref:DUF998 domain-containing protein n=1 Tax=Hymenobacter defluvii TaxID=2054411 RepID=A0ABS3TI41_9BACT|nr:hypothetical protein [Hymenobacter defluvii]MBO3273339.1 hypothetical protein [Hymenobacter defluvii]
MGSHPSQRRVLLLAVGLALFLFGQFEERVFTWLTSGWQVLFSLVGHPEWGVTSHAVVSNISTHGLPVASSYRLLYCSLSVLLLHLLLRGRHTRWIAGGYGATLTVGLVLLLLGHLVNMPFASRQGHFLIDLACSLEAVLLTYVAMTLRPPQSTPTQMDYTTQDVSVSPTRGA